MVRRFAYALACVLILLLAWPSGTGGPAHHFETITYDGVTTATTRGGPLYDDPLFTYTRVLQLEEDPENDASFMLDPGRFIKDDTGLYYVIAPLDNKVTMFNEEGAFVRGFGRKSTGTGSSEFITVNDVTVRDELVRVYDQTNRRIYRFLTDGTLIDWVTGPPPSRDSVPRTVTNMYSLTGGRIIAISEFRQEKRDGVDRSVGVAVMTDRHALVWSHQTPFVRDLIATTGPGGNRLSWSAPFAHRPNILYQPGRGILVSTGSEPELEWYDPEGRMRMRVRILMEPLPITPEDEARVIAGLDREAAEFEHAESAVAEIEARKAALVFPDRKPYWTHVMVDNLGYTWLRVSEHVDEMTEAGGGYLYRVVSPEGEYLGDTRLPKADLMSVSHGELRVTNRNWETGGTSLIVYRIESAIPGLQYP
jgi:hypothetical protein